MQNIEKLRQEAEEARAKIDEKFYQEFNMNKHSLIGLAAIADAIITATIAQIALQAAEKEAEARKYEPPKPYDDDRLIVDATFSPAPVPDAQGWIAWEGGDCPIPEIKNFEWKMRDGSSYEEIGYSANNLRWTHLDLHGDIVAYRVIGAADRAGGTMSENTMRDFLIAKLKCSKCGTTLKLSYEPIPINRNDFSIDRDREPTGACMRGLDIAVEPCQTCPKPLNDVAKAMRVLNDLAKIEEKS